MASVDSFVKFTLALTVSLSLLLPALVLTGGLAYQVYSQERPQKLQQALTHYADLIAGSMSHNLWNLDENAAKALMTNLRKDPAVMRVRIEQADGRRINRNPESVSRLPVPSIRMVN